MIPILSVLKNGSYLVAFEVEEDPMPKFVFDDEQIAIDRERKIYALTNQQRAAEEFEFIRELKESHREELIELYEDQRKELIYQFTKITENYKDCVQNGKPNWLCSVFKEIEKPDQIAKKIKQLITDVDFLKGRMHNKEGGITDDDIVKAKNHPFDSLIETKNGVANCPFHQDRTPSFSIHKKGNFAYCFGCNKGVDTIQFIMETKNLSFIDAVKYLK